MKAITKKSAVFFPLPLLLMGIHYVYAAKSAYPPSAQEQKIAYRNVPNSNRKLLVGGYCRVHSVPTDICFLIRCFVYDNPLQYRNKPLPNDLSGQDLSGFDFTGCVFTYTNLSYTDLTNVILTNTTCDYQKAFLDNIKKNKLQGGDWYQENLPNDLRSIAEVYPKLNNVTQKVKLLHIACGISFLPFYEETEFYIKVQYFSSLLRQLKQVLGNPYRKQMVCSLQSSLEYDANNYCWKTKYPQHKVNIDAKTSHANFVQYLEDFTNGLVKYQCKSKYDYGFDWYKDNIIKNIEGLEATYPNIKDATLQQEAFDIAHALSKSYQIQQGTFLDHYLFYQHRLMRLKKSVGIGVKNKVHYSPILRAI